MPDLQSSVSGILTINGGSSSLKFALFEKGAKDTLTCITSGKIERIGLTDPNLQIGSNKFPIDIRTHAEALPLLVKAIKEKLGEQPLGAIGHRIVHGGPDYREHQLVTPEMIGVLEQFGPFDPEHLPAEISLMRCCAEHFPNVPQFACFDTAFHRDLPRVAYLLPIPRRFEQHGVRRYGFHGLSCAWLMQELEQIAGPDIASRRVVIAHLGNGASMTAVQNRRSVDTTMSFTPTAGLVMSRRTGDLDPGIAGYLARTEKMSIEQFQHMINAESGLLGISEISSDMRDLLAAEKTDARAADAIASFCYSAKKHLAALAATMGGLDTLIFSGGIGESSPEIRGRICEDLQFLGIAIDPVANKQNASTISQKRSRVTVYVIKTDEEMFIAQTVNGLLQKG
jgi:acetate kinase